MSEGFNPKDRFSLLRVCRQVYSETAILPQTLTTFFFFDTDVYRSYIKAGLVKRLKHVMIGAWRGSTSLDTTHFPRKYVPDLLTADVILWYRAFGGVNSKPQIDNYFPTASVTVRQVYAHDEYHELWKGRLAFEDLPNPFFVSHETSSVVHATNQGEVSPTIGRLSGGKKQGLDTLGEIEVKKD
jgi:hypothetical protein